MRMILINRARPEFMWRLLFWGMLFCYIACIQWCTFNFIFWVSGGPKEYNSCITRT